MSLLKIIVSEIITDYDPIQTIITPLNDFKDPYSVKELKIHIKSDSACLNIKFGSQLELRALFCKAADSRLMQG